MNNTILSKIGGWRNLSGRFWAQAFIILVLFILLNKLFFSQLLLDLSRYQIEIFHKETIFTGSVSSWWMLGLCGCSILPFIFFKKLNWNGIQNGLYLRVLFASMITLLGWMLAFSGYNHFLDQAFLFDRILIMLFAILVWVHPAFIGPFLMVALPFQAQYFVPFGWAYPHLKRILFDYGFLLLAFGMLSTVIKVRPVLIFITAISIHLSDYFYSGLGKLLISPKGIDWIWTDEISILPGNAHLRGWLSGSEGLFKTISGFVDALGPGILIFILLVEIGVIVFFLHRRIGVWLLVLLTCMHLGIALMVGIFFWTWIILNILLILVLLFQKHPDKVFSKRSLAFSLIFIAVSGLLLEPSRLSWLESRFQWYFELEVEAEDGQSYYLEKNDLDPYAHHFAHDIFTFIYDETILGFNGYCTLNHEEMTELKSSNVSDIPQLKEKYGRNHFQEGGLMVFDEFILKYFQTRNKRLNKDKFLSAMMPPNQLYMFRNPQSRFEFEQPVSKVRVYFKEYLWNGNQYLPVTDTLVREVIVQESYNE